MIVDPKSVTNKIRQPNDHIQLGIIGAGPAGVAAAIAGAKAGLSVALIDENPVSAGLMGMDVPLFYGQRMDAAVQKRERMLERVFEADPMLAEAFELGVDIRLGIQVWGAFVNGPNLQALPGPLLGLADDERSWLCGFDRLVVAAGGRDLVLSFAGADLPGVMGGVALQSLLTAYQSFAGRRVLILGSGPFAADTARLALAHGLEVVAAIEPRPQAQSPELALLGVTVLTSHIIAGCSGGADGVTQATIRALDANAEDKTLGCDTICLAIGRVPTVELLSVLGCKLAWHPEHGGHVPVLDADGRSSIPAIFAAGDCAGLCDAPTAAAQGARAALTAAGDLGHPQAPAQWQPLTLPVDPAYRMDWMRALLATGGLAPLACHCEEVTRQEVLGLRPPRYLGEATRAHSLEALQQDGPLDPDQVKRLTRAGMGACQGRRCREQVALLLAAGTLTDPAKIPLASYRAPVRPLPLSVLTDTDEAADMTDNWEVWFGIQGQWVPYRDIGTEREKIDRYGNEVDVGHL